MSRVPSLSRDHAASIDQQPLWDRLEAERKVPTANIFRTLANAPVLLDAFLSYANALRDGSELSPKLRELAILSVGHATGSEYEIAHHQSHGRKAGITDEQLAAVADAANSGLFTEAELASLPSPGSPPTTCTCPAKRGMPPPHTWMTSKWWN